MSDETRKKMSESQKGRVVSDETRMKMSEAKKGKPGWNKGAVNTVSDETRKRMRLSATKRTRKHLEFFNQVYLTRADSFQEDHRQILKMFVEGFSNGEIVEKLGVQDYYIKNVLRSIKTKVLSA